jgi:transposase
MEAKKKNAEAKIKEIRRVTRKKYSAEEKIRIVIEGLRGEYSIAELCRKEGIHPNLFYNWSKEFMEAGKRRLAGDTKREATSGEVQSLKNENAELKEIVADLTLELQRNKKNTRGIE